MPLISSATVEISVYQCFANSRSAISSIVITARRNRGSQHGTQTVAVCRLLALISDVPVFNLGSETGCLDRDYLEVSLVPASKYLLHTELHYDIVLHFSVSIINLSGWANKEEWDGRCVWHVGGRGEAPTRFRWGTWRREPHGRSRRREDNFVVYMMHALDANLLYVRGKNRAFVTTKICCTVL